MQAQATKRQSSWRVKRDSGNPMPRPWAGRTWCFFSHTIKAQPPAQVTESVRKRACCSRYSCCQGHVWFSGFCPPAIRKADGRFSCLVPKSSFGLVGSNSDASVILQVYFSQAKVTSEESQFSHGSSHASRWEGRYPVVTDVTGLSAFGGPFLNECGQWACFFHYSLFSHIIPRCCWFGFLFLQSDNYSPLHIAPYRADMSKLHPEGLVACQLGIFFTKHEPRPKPTSLKLSRDLANQKCQQSPFSFCNMLQGPNGVKVHLTALGSLETGAFFSEVTFWF